MTKMNMNHPTLKYHIKYSREQAVYDKDPNWCLGRSTYSAKLGINRCSLFYNHKKVADLIDDFTIMDQLETFVNETAITHPTVIYERVKLGLITPEEITDKKLQKRLIREQIVTVEFAKEHYNEAYTELAKAYQQTAISQTTQTTQGILTVTLDSVDYNDLHYSGTYELIDKDITATTCEFKSDVYHKIDSVWVNSIGEPLDKRKSCESIWDMRKMVATQQATLEESFLYTEGACLQVIGDIAHKTVKNYVIPALYELSKNYAVNDTVDSSMIEFANVASVVLEYLKLGHSLLKKYLEGTVITIKFYQYPKVIANLHKILTNLIADETTKVITEQVPFQEHINTITKFTETTYSPENREALFKVLEWYESQIELHTKILESCDTTPRELSPEDKKYANLYKAVLNDITQLQYVLTTDDPVIVQALTLPYAVEDANSMYVTPKVQTYQEFIVEVQRRIYSVMSSIPMLCGFNQVKDTNTYTPVYTHKQRIGQQAAPYMDYVWKVMTYQMSGYEAYLRNQGRWDGICNREHGRFKTHPWKQFIPFFHDKALKIKNATSLREIVVYMATNINDLRAMGLREMERKVTAFNYNGMRYQLDCDSLNMRAFMPVCNLSTQELYYLAKAAKLGEVSAEEVLERCKDPLLTEKITAEKNCLYSRMRKWFGYSCKKLIDRLLARYGAFEDWTGEMWDNYDYEKHMLKEEAIQRYFNVGAFGSYHMRDLDTLADVEIDNFKTWWKEQKDQMSHVYQRVTNALFGNRRIAC